ncbi:MAG: hypothetical protein JNG84_08650 [Archangium sp.]|nr:hypothetical protein [Archangium sp.]
MNSKLLATVAALALVAQSAVAQEAVSQSSSVESPNVLIFNPGDLINGIVSVEYERALTSFFGLAFGLSVMSFRGAFAPADSATVTALGPELSARFHFIRDAPRGLWIGPSIQGVYIAARSGGTVNRAFGYGLGAAVGYNFSLGHHFVLQLGVGGGFNDYGEGIAWAPRFRLGLGGRF